MSVFALIGPGWVSVSSLLLWRRQDPQPHPHHDLEAKAFYLSCVRAHSAQASDWGFEAIKQEQLSWGSGEKKNKCCAEVGWNINNQKTFLLHKHHTPTYAKRHVKRREKMRPLKPGVNISLRHSHLGYLRPCLSFINLKWLEMSLLANALALAGEQLASIQSGWCQTSLQSVNCSPGTSTMQISKETRYSLKKIYVPN